MKIIMADINDVPELYELQLISFESEAEMIGSRDVPALIETKEENEKDFASWNTVKLIDDFGKIIGSIRYRKTGDVTEVGRLMVHPNYRRKGLAQKLIAEIDLICPEEIKELYTCTKSWTNIKLYEKMGYKAFKEKTEPNGLSFVYMRKK